MERWEAKVICLFGIMILPFVCTMAPYKVHEHFARKGKSGKRVLSCLMCFGGGVFFATFILHMGPEVRYILDEALIQPNNIQYPVADLIIGLGFFVVFFLEKIILKCYKKQQLKKRARRQEQCYQFNKVNSNVTTASPIENGVWPQDAKNLSHVVNGTLVPSERIIDPENCPLKGTGECCTDTPDITIQMMTAENEELAAAKAAEEDIAYAHNTRSLVLVVALSLHRIFEGMSLGLQHTTHNVWNLFIAVLCHETVIGFGLGLQFVKNGFGLKKMFIASSLCSIIMPVGVAIGTVLVEVGGQSNNLNLVNGILQGISTGTFIYVTFFEILQEEIDPHDTSLSRFFSVLLGFGVMAAMTAIPEEQQVLLLANMENITTTVVPNIVAP
ncbi:hypothetical protein LSH36_593g01018 [Paralvinella palmiformis]|uniref:Uncharacterized protein n=1 Tax=Paralvinella palmiformis TaxID=53620 RepID=A0AAD9J580_9ANNE|nr:hypothetical protein LSH36_593g01018 [Paralvinella palmiformis]